MKKDQSEQKTVILSIPDTSHGAITYRQVKEYCYKNEHIFDCHTFDDKSKKPSILIYPGEDVLWGLVRTRKNPKEIIKKFFDDVKMLKNFGYETEDKKILSKRLEKIFGEVVQEIIGFKNINLFLLNNQKTNQKPYFFDSPEDGTTNSDNWPRKRRAETDNVTRNTYGKVVMQTPVHLLEDHIVCLNPEKKERDRTYRVKNSPKPYRKFDGNKNKHCSHCPFPEGCVMCTLP